MATTTEGGGVPGLKRTHLGIPEAVFVEDVESFMKKPGNETADIVLKRLDEQYQKYKFMELNLSQKKRRLKSQIPEIKQTLEILKHMQKKKDTTEPMETRFLLADNLYSKASVPPTDKVCLWLGANVMLEYDIDEAQALLEKNLSTATKNLESTEEDLDFLRDQFTITEVNMARVYNWDVKRRHKEDPSKIKA
ncbi:prefoldin subunit 3 [Spea bombifrons]|uniref:prefoldin subunit 3 n=1 Tax=Spea bombifrons TaxID=233779 RepID=UPI00234B8C32|nr:prefoldin subunit 3 [Spea bombifrons]